MPKEIERHLTANAHMSKRDIIVGNFLGGMAWGLGTVFGATVVVASIGAVLKSIGVFDQIGWFFNQLISK